MIKTEILLATQEEKINIRLNCLEQAVNSTAHREDINVFDAEGIIRRAKKFEEYILNNE